MLSNLQIESIVGSMANNNIDPVNLANNNLDQWVIFPRGKGLEWKPDFLKFKKQNFGDCCKMITEGAEVALKVEEKLSHMEAKVKNGEGDEKLRLKVEVVRMKVERYHCLMHLFSASKSPERFAEYMQLLSLSKNRGEFAASLKQKFIANKQRHRRQRQHAKKISKRASHQTLIQLSENAFEQFVAWKGNWSNGREFVEGETGASVKNRLEGKFFISGDESAVKRAINMIVTQSLAGVASPDDYTIFKTEL